MPRPKKRVVIFGVTGSVGQQALSVLKSEGYLLVGISYRMNIALGQQVARQWKVEHSYCPNGSGSCASYGELLDRAAPDIVLNAVSGFAGLQPTIETLSRGLPLALANKESLVVAGKHVMALSRANKAPIYPVDSEHASLYELIRADRTVKQLIITASGGPFVSHSLEELSAVSKKQALHHPRWSMGAKISIDSATMMNKALELIEAHWLFGIDVRAVIHPQAVVHAVVQHADNSYIALLAAPDMKWAVQRALHGFKKSQKAVISPLDFTRLTLEFMEPDLQRWPALALAQRCLARADSTLPAIVNALNERSVSMFLNDQLSFAEIVHYVVARVEDYPVIDHPSLDQIKEVHNLITGGK